jgi:C4-dicarboxylate transporter DctM subunit
MVVFATTASVSIGSLFMAGVVPGILLTVSFCIMHIVRYRKIESPSVDRLSLKEAVQTFLDAIFALGMPLIILGGIYGGFFTPTEAAAVSCIYSLIVGCFIYRTLTLKQIWNSMCEISVRVSSMLTIVCVASAMAWYVSSSGLAQMISNAVLNGLSSKFMILTAINVLLFILGCLIDPTSIILLTCPIIIPITQSLGMSTVAVGAFMIMNIAVGMVTPPFAGTLKNP